MRTMLLCLIVSATSTIAARGEPPPVAPVPPAGCTCGATGCPANPAPAATLVAQAHPPAHEGQHEPFTLDTPPVPPPAPPEAPEAPPQAPAAPQSWLMRDVRGQWWRHASKATLEDWMRAHNAVLEPRRYSYASYQQTYPSPQVTESSPPVTYSAPLTYAAPSYGYSTPSYGYSTPSYGSSFAPAFGGFFAGGGGCSGGSCR